MGKYNDLLIEFMTEKNRIVRKHTRLLIATKPDMDELRSWSEDRCKRVLDRMDLCYDGGLCPWCLGLSRQRGKCKVCTYAFTNGMCDFPHSRYWKIFSRLNKRIFLIDEIQKLYQNTNSKFKSINYSADSK